MYKVIIVDDEPMARERIADLLETETDIRVEAQCRNGVEAVEAITECQPDLVFLDIQMPGMDGFEVLAQLDETAIPEIIFVTAYDQYTLQAFSAHALDYLLKPFDDDRFGEALNYARRRIEKKAAPAPKPTDTDALLSFIKKMEKQESYLKRIQVKANKRISLVKVETIDSIEAEGYYVRLRCGEADYLIRKSLNQLENQLDPAVFARVHRSTIININAIKELQHWSQSEWMAILKNGAKYVVSRNYRDKLKDIL